MLISAARAETLKLANQREAAEPHAPVLIHGTDRFDLSAARALADPALDLANPLKGPFKAEIFEWAEDAAAALAAYDAVAPSILGVAKRAGLERRAQRAIRRALRR